MKNYILISLVLFSFLTCKGHIENNDSKPFLEQKANYSEQKNDSASHKQVEEEILNKKKQKDSIKEDAFYLFLKSKNVACVYEEKYDENHFLNEVYIIKNVSLREVFKLIKGYEFDTDVIILEKRKLENYKEEKEIPYYTQTVFEKNGTIRGVNCEFMFDGGVTTIRLEQPCKNTILTVMYST